MRFLRLLQLNIASLTVLMGIKAHLVQLISSTKKHGLNIKHFFQIWDDFRGNVFGYF